MDNHHALAAPPYNLTDHDITEGLSTVTDCEKLCNATLGCVVVVWHGSDRHCHILTGPVTRAQFSATLNATAKADKSAACMHVAAAPVPTPAPVPLPVYKCTVCAHIYDPATDAAPSPAGTKFEDLQDTWVCPVCGAPKSAYLKQVGASGEEVWAHTHDEGEIEAVRGRFG
jgi:rubredoxin